eukprot:3954847-Lingulodinium_polyedra.AAC.1
MADRGCFDRRGGGGAAGCRSTGSGDLQARFHERCDATMAPSVAAEHGALRCLLGRRPDGRRSSHA